MWRCVVCAGMEVTVLPDHSNLCPTTQIEPFLPLPNPSSPSTHTYTLDNASKRRVGKAPPPQMGPGGKATFWGEIERGRAWGCNVQVGRGGVCPCRIGAWLELGHGLDGAWLASRGWVARRQLGFGLLDSPCTSRTPTRTVLSCLVVILVCLVLFLSVFCPLYVLPCPGVCFSSVCLSVFLSVCRLCLCLCFHFTKSNGIEN